MTLGRSPQESGPGGESHGVPAKGQRSEYPVTRGLFEEIRCAPSPEVRLLKGSLLMTYLGGQRGFRVCCVSRDADSLD